ncbi:MAG: hypothetical protein PGN09_09125 [Sphingomonas fennica]
MQRVRAGLTGLACVFLIVLLAAAFLNIARDRDADARDAAEVAANRAAPEPARDPLAELGVAPDAAVPAAAGPPAPTPPPARAP